MKYPKFTKPLYQVWFKHWLVERLNCQNSTCLECVAMREVIVFGTRLLLNSLFADQKRFLNGSNVLGIAIGSISRKHARSILKTYPYITNSKDIEDRNDFHITKINSDFPNLEAHNLESYSQNLMPLIQRTDDNLYVILSALYKTAMSYEYCSIVPAMGVVEYVMLCCHLNKQLLLSAGVVSNMWAETLKHDAILLLYDMSTLDFDAIQYALQPTC